MLILIHHALLQGLLFTLIQPALTLFKELTMRKPKGYPTGVNAFAVAEQIKKHGFVPSRVPAVDAPHIKRVLKWGGLEPREGGGFQLTPKGFKVLKEHGYDLS